MPWYVWEILSIVGAFIVPALIGFVEQLTLFQEFLIGGFVFLILNAIKLLELSSKISEIRLQEQRAWVEQDQFDSLLASIRNDYKNMRLQRAGGGSLLVQQLVYHRLEKLRDEVHVAAESRELYVANNHSVDTSRVTDLFRNKHANQLCEVFDIDSGPVFGIYAAPYFRQLYDLVCSRHIERARVLLVVDPSDCGAVDKASKLNSFYENTPNYDVRVISKESFQELHVDSGLELFEDFGLYGDALLFQTVGYAPVSRGKYSYDSIKIAKFQDFFDACWNQPPGLILPAIDPPLRVDEAIKL